MFLRFVWVEESRREMGLKICKGRSDPAQRGFLWIEPRSAGQLGRAERHRGQLGGGDRENRGLG